MNITEFGEISVYSRYKHLRRYIKMDKKDKDIKIVLDFIKVFCRENHKNIGKQYDKDLQPAFPACITMNSRQNVKISINTAPFDRLPTRYKV